MTNLKKSNQYFFYKTKLIVDKNVFRPRFETEQLVDCCQEIIKAFWKENKFSILEIGTGSGAIAISLAKIFPQAEIVGTDVYWKAINCAKKNGDKAGTKIQWKKSNLFDNINQKFNVIVANLPYVADGFSLNKDVLDKDPKIALFGGKNGLDLFHKFFEQVKNFLADRFVIALEFGWDQKSELKNLLKIYLPKIRYNFLKDYQKQDRFLFIYNLY